MFKVIEVEQRSPEWFEARLGKWTASSFARAITASGSISSSADENINRLVAEVITGKPDESFTSDAMERGTNLESEALDHVNFVIGADFKPTGLVVYIDDFSACSPDGIDWDKSIGLELKCPSAHTHIGYLAGETLPPKYKQQVQGSMFVTGFKQWVFASYHPDLPAFIITVDRDEEYIKKLSAALSSFRDTFSERLTKTVAKFEVE